jgi:amino acid transporter/nucleotide-binding universal stress UspA family protein
LILVTAGALELPLMAVGTDTPLITDVHLSREMSVFSVTMIGVGAMIGAGIFVLTGIAAGVAGPALILVFLLNGVVTLFTAMAYAELGSCFHDAGGGYLWIKQGLPQPNGFLSGWMSWFAHAVACSLYALGFGAYFGHVLTEGFGARIPELPLSLDKLLALVACVIFAYINFRGASETGKMGNVVTVAKVLVIGLFIAFGLATMSARPGWQAEFKPFLPAGMGAVFMAMGLTFIAFQGYEVIAQCSEEIIDPRRNIPRAVFLALLIVIPIYVLVAITALGAISGHGMPTWQYLGAQKEIAMVEAAKQFLPGGAVIFLVGGLLSTLSALNATIYSSSRVAFAMGRDANLPDFFARVHAKKRTPHLAILASTFIVMAMALLLPIEDVASAADLMFLLIFIQVNVVVIRLRKKRPDLNRGFRVPLMPAIPILGIATQVFIAVYLIRYSPKAFVTALVWIGVGAVVHYRYASKKEAKHTVLREAIQRLVRKDYRILVPLGVQENIGTLMSVALAIAHQFDGEIVALSVIEVPFQTPLTSAAVMPDMQERRNNLRLAERIAERESIPCRRYIKVAHRLSQAILDTAREEECNFIILGRSARPRFGSRVVRSFMDRVLMESPCHVAVVKCSDASNVGRVLVPVDDDRNSRLALELLPAFVSRWKAGAEIMALTLDGSYGKARADQLFQRLSSEFPFPAGATTSFVEGVMPTKEILGKILPTDFIVMGESQWTGLAHLFGSTLPDEIAERTDRPVVFIKAYEPKRRRSLMYRLLTGA